MFRNWWRPLARRRSPSPRPRKRSPWQRRLPLYLEPLEERILLSGQAGLPPDLVVGRTLSSYFVGGVQNNQETITYTVYNEQADPETGVLLTDTLEPGVTVAGASPLPDQSGPKLAWSLGTIQGFDRASVTLTVNLATPTPLQLDTGAQAFATLNAGAVSNTTPAAVLRPGNVSDPSLLTSTPDANTTDSYIQEQAAKLNYDPQQIFAYLHNDVGYNSYTGSLRGARGTLWSAAGNALDVASLGVALMRASGIPAQYASGTLSQAQAQQLILSMFPASFQTVGYIPAGTQTADPANDPQLLAETESHYWFRFDAGSGMQDADPLMAGAMIGQAFATSTGAFTEVPDNLREKTEVKLTAELYYPGFAGLIGALDQLGGAAGIPGTSQAVVLDHTFNDVDLVGHPVAIGNFVNSTPVPTIFSPVTNTYSPYLAVGDDAFPDPSHDEVIRGQDYQEILSSFPLANQVLTGLFLDITTADPQGNGQTKSDTIRKTLFDRIGYVARQGGVASSISADPSGPPALSPLDVTTLLIAPSAPTPAALMAEQGAIGAGGARLRADAAQPPAGSSAAAGSSAQVASDITQALGQLTAFVGDDFLALSAASSGLAASTLLVKTYFDSPQIIAVSGRIGVDKTSTQPRMQLETDILRDTPRGLAAPGQGLGTAKDFQTLHGLGDSALEGQVLQELGGPGGFTGTSSFDVFSAAAAAGTPIIVINKGNLASLSSLPLSDEAKARITAAVDKGQVVLTPTAMTAVNGGLTTAWVEVDPGTGSEVYVSENGSHGALTEMGTVYVFIVPVAVLAGEVEPQVAAYLGAEDAAIATSADVIGADAQAAINELNALLDRQLSANLNVNNPSIEAYEQGFFEEIQAEIARLQQVLQFRAMQPPVYVRPPEPPIFVRPPAPWVGPVPGSGSPLPAPVPTPVPRPLPTPLPFPPTLPNLGGGNGSGNPDLPAPEHPHYISSVPPAPPPDFPPDSFLPDSERRIDEGPGQQAGDPPVSLAAGPTSAVTALGSLDASWHSSGTTAFLVQSLNANGASVVDENGKPVGSGAVSLASAAATVGSLSGELQLEVTGTGILSFYGPSRANLGVSARWGNYTATATGTVSVTLTTGGLTLNGAALPAGMYTISANAATLSGSGNAPSPDFSSSVAIRVTGGTVGLGPGTGNLVVGANPVDATSGATLTGYTGDVTVAGNDGATDNVSLDGGADNVLTVSSTAAAPTTDQNTPVTFHVNVNTTFTDGYVVSAHAPPGWGVSIDSAGNVTVTPAPGLQGGTYPIQVIAQSTADPDLVARASVNVTITPTAPGLTFNIVPDPVFTVPFHGAQLPTAFRAVVHNNGPTADTYNLSFSNIPSGFTLLNSGTSVTVPAGQTGILGIYLQPSASQPMPAPGTQLSFTVTATSASNSAITQTQTENFTVPAIDAVTLSSNPPSLNTTPGTPVTATATLANVGNVPENITLAASDSPGLTASSLNPVSLAVGQSTTETVTLTPDASTPLNSTLQATITATFGPTAAPVTQTLTLPVNVVVPGAEALANAAVTAGQLGNTNLADRLDDLSTALTNLVQNPTSPVYTSQAQANIAGVLRLLSADAFAGPLTPMLTNDAAALAQATTASAVQAAVVRLGSDLGTLSQTLTDEAAHGFTLSLVPNTATVLAGAPADFPLDLVNTGTTATTYDLGVTGLPANVTAQFVQNGTPVTSVTAQPGQDLFGGSNGVTLELSETGGSLFPTGFAVTATAKGAPEITQSVRGTVTVPPNFVAVTEVDANPPSIAPGSGSVAVTARVLNSVNRQQQALASYTVTDTNGKVVFTSTAVALTLTVQTSLATVDLGNFSTAGLAAGSYTLNVTLTDPSGKPIPGGTGQGSVLVGTPVSASLSVSPTTLSAGSGTVTNTLTINPNPAGAGGVALLGQVADTSTPWAVAVQGTLAYVADSNGIDIVDVSDPTKPKVVSTFGQNDLARGGNDLARIVGNQLVVTSQASGSGWEFIVYSLANPLSPQLLGKSFLGPAFMTDLAVTTTGSALVSSNVVFSGGGVSGQGGNVTAVNFSNPSQSALASRLSDNDLASPPVSQTRELDVAVVNNQIAYVASSTSSGGQPSGQPTTVGEGRLLVVNIQDPTKLQEYRLPDGQARGSTELDIPGTESLQAIGVEGNRALLVGDTEGINGSFQEPGNITLTTLDISDPLNPQIIKTVVTPNSKSGAPLVQDLGKDQFALTGTDLNGNPVLEIIDVSNPSSPAFVGIPVPDVLNGGITAAGGKVYVTSANGLSIYNLGQFTSVPVTASVEVPKGTGVSVVANSFNIPPTQIVHGANFDTLEWSASLATATNFTWQSKVSNLQAGEARPVTLGGSVAFTSNNTPGSLALSPTVVSGAQVLGLSPASQTVAPGAPAAYTVTVTNPTSSADTFNLSVLGVPAGWVNLPASVTVPANSSSNVILTQTSDVFAALGDRGFTVTAADGNGARAAVQGDLLLAGQPAAVDPEAHGVVVALTPAENSAGQGTAAQYVLQITNTGSADDTFALTAAGLPAGVTAAFSQATVEVPPGASNFRDVTLTLTPQTGTAAGSDSFTVMATSTTRASVSDTTAGTLDVLSAGVGVTLNPPAGTPGSGFQLTVENTGQTADTFDLSLGGPAALVATLGMNKVTLAPGASQMVPVTTGAVDFADAGPLSLAGFALSESNPAVQANASSALTIPATTGMTAELSPSAQVLPVPGTSSFLVLVHNTGNTEDTYTATITGTQGPVTGNLMGLDGLPTQTVPVFRLPGLSTGALVLNAGLAARGQGTVTVRVQSLTDPLRAASVTATVSTPAPAASTPPPLPAAAPPLVTTPSAVAEDTAPVLAVTGAHFTPASVVRLRLRAGGSVLVLRLRTRFVGPGLLAARVPLVLPAAFGGSRWVLDEGRVTTVSVFTPGVGETAAVPLLVLEAAVPGRVADAREAAVLEFLERRAHREVTLDDFVPRALDARFVDQMFQRFHLEI